MRKIMLPALFLWAFSAACGQASAAKPALSPGVERWPVKTSVPAGTNFSKPLTIAYSALAAMPEVAGVTKDDARYQSSRITETIAGGYTEGQLLSVTGYIWLVAGETDGDYHIQVSGSPTSGDQCVIVEVPDPDPRFTADVNLQPKARAVRTLIKARMLKGNDPSPNGSVMNHPVYVTITGILFYDDAHVNTPPRGKKGMHAAGLWELHPVTSIAFAVKPQ